MNLNMFVLGSFTDVDRPSVLYACALSNFLTYLIPTIFIFRWPRELCFYGTMITSRT